VAVGEARREELQHHLHIILAIAVRYQIPNIMGTSRSLFGIKALGNPDLIFSAALGDDA
jgi:hypothetical protein